MQIKQFGYRARTSVKSTGSGRCAWLVAMMLGMLCALPASAGTSSPAVKVKKVAAQGAQFYIQLDSSVSTPSNPHTCTNWSGNYVAYLTPIDDSSKAQLAVALTAFATGKTVNVSSTSCTAGNNPIVDSVFVNQ